MRWISLLTAALLVGCDKPRVTAEPPQAAGKPIPPDDASNGPRYTLKGQIVWTGDLPQPPALPAVFGKIEKLAPPLNAYFPVIDEKSRGVANVVVWVKLGENFKPQVPKQNLKLAGETHRLSFGERKAPVAVTTVGSELELTTSIEGPSTIAARGASFFSLAFPKPGTVHKRTFEKAGPVDFYNASGDYWATCRAYVFDDPGFAITDANGNFEIRGVPLGNHELTWSIADYRMDKYERDPDTQAIMRLKYKEPINKVQPIKLNRDQELKLEVGAGDFRR